MDLKLTPTVLFRAIQAVADSIGANCEAKMMRAMIAASAETESEMPASAELRDYFAAKALQGLISEPMPGDNEGDTTLVVVMRETGEHVTSASQAFAHCAYALADAMLAERAK